MVTFKGAALPRSQGIFASVASGLGVEVAAFRAIVDVETRGSGFDASGRPKALFEPHRFYRELLKQPEKLDQAIKAGLAYREWGEKPYPADSYPRILKALAIDETAALNATSWGLGQILGSNSAIAGYSSPQRMLAAFLEGEDSHIASMAAFLRAKKLVRPLREKNWDAVAAGYNGKRYREGGYQTKLAHAYRDRPAAEKIAPRSSTATPVVELPPIPRRAPVAEAPSLPASLDAPDENLREVQGLLLAAGYPVGGVDGLWGSMTRTALRGFKGDWNDLQVGAPFEMDLSIGEDVKNALRVFKRPVAAARAEAKPSDIKKAGDPLVGVLLRLRNWAFGLAASGGAAIATGQQGDDPIATLEQVSGSYSRVREALQPFASVSGFLADHWIWVAGAALLVLGLWAQAKLKSAVQDYKSGARP